MYLKHEYLLVSELWKHIITPNNVRKLYL